MKKVKFDLCQAGYCTHPEIVTIEGGSFRRCQFPSLFGLIRHPQEGLILYDTGYHPRYNSQVNLWPEGLYPRFLPAQIENQSSAVEQIKHLGYGPDDVTAIVISHFHGDHIAGLIDFPKARLLCMRSAFEAVDNKSKWKNLFNGYLPTLLPTDFKKRMQWIEDIGQLNANSPWSMGFRSYDIFKDQSIYSIALDGHKEGQIGLGFESDQRGPCSLVADAAWSRKAISEFRSPSRLATLTMKNRSTYLSTLCQLNRFSTARPDVQLIPSHCRETFSQWSAGLK